MMTLIYANNMDLEKSFQSKFHLDFKQIKIAMIWEWISNVKVILLQVNKDTALNTSNNYKYQKH